MSWDQGTVADSALRLRRRGLRGGLRRLLELLLRLRCLTGGGERGVVRPRLVLSLLLDAARDRGADVLGLEPERVHEVERVRTQPLAQPADVTRHGGRALRGQTAVDEVPGEVLLDQLHP